MTTPTPPAFRLTNHWSVSSCLVCKTVLVWKGELDDEVRQALCLNGYPGVVFDVELTEFDCPRDHSPYCFKFVHELLNGFDLSSPV